MFTEYVVVLILCFKLGDCQELRGEPIYTTPAECKILADQNAEILKQHVKAEYPGIVFRVVSYCKRTEKRNENTVYEQIRRWPGDCLPD
jgi:hypothetical protein